MRTYNSTPNFTVILPVGCNAKCDFCFWHDSKKFRYRNFDLYLENLKKTIESTPSGFNQVSISGGEPTLLTIDQFEAVLNILSERFDKIILNTNGHKLLDLLRNSKLTREKLSGINLSRHDTMDLNNHGIFKTSSVPGDIELIKINEIFKTRLNVVFDDKKETPDIHKWSEYSKLVGSDGVAFRRLADNGVKGITQLQKDLRKKGYEVSQNSCKVCYGAQYKYNGVSMFIRHSVDEPLDYMKKDVIFELITDIYGKAHSSWDNKNKTSVDVSKIKVQYGFLENILTKLLKFLYNETI